jgi:DNA replication protein DnaC
MESKSKKTGLIINPINPNISESDGYFAIRTNEGLDIKINNLPNKKPDEFELYGTIEHFTDSTITILAKKEDNIYECSYNTSTLKIEVGDAIAVKIKTIKIPNKEIKCNIISKPLIIISSKQENIVELFRKSLSNRIKAKALMEALLKEYNTIEELIKSLSLFAIKWWDPPILPGITKKQSLEILREWNYSRNYRQLFLFGLKWDEIHTYTKYTECDILDMVGICLTCPSFLFILDNESANEIAQLTNAQIDKSLHTFCSVLYEETLHGKMFISGSVLTQDQKAALSQYPVKILKENIYLTYPYTVQESLGNHIRKLFNRNSTIKHNINNIAINPLFSDQQKEILKIALISSLTVILGPAGSGKSLLLTGIYQNFVANNIPIILGCPTGMAAANLRIMLKCSDPRTLHYFLKKEGAPKVLLIDEISMLTPELLLKILDRFPSIQQLILIGDPNQLPPVKGFGSIVAALENLPCCYKLKETFRFGDDLLKSSLKILDGKVPKDNNSFNSVPGKEENLIDAYKELIENKVGLNDILILSPLNKVVESINNTIQEYLKEKKNRKRSIKDSENNIWVIGDKVIFLENNPDCDVYNGQLGTIIDLNRDLVTVEFVDTIVSLKTRYNKDKIKKKYFDGDFEDGYTESKDMATNLIKLAYAVTIHKAQGSQAPIVLIYLPYLKREGFITQNLLYTGITRAQTNVLLIGDMDTFKRGCKAKHELYPIKLGDP